MPLTDVAARWCGKIRILPFLFAAACAQGTGTPSPAPPPPADTVAVDLSGHFRALGAEGAFVLYDPAASRWVVHDPEQARRGVLPASTFKIPNSLIALETGALRDEHQVLAWDGVERGWDAWDRDHSMATAFPVSAVWFYQEVARRVGQERMDEWVRRIGYGNGDTGGGLDTFWLTGALRISAFQQVDLLRRLHAGDLPFSAGTMETVRRVMRIEERDGAVLSGKTGWARADGRHHGWLVGWVEREGEAVFFATRVGSRDPDFPMRRAQQEITRGILAELGVYP